MSTTQTLDPPPTNVLEIDSADLPTLRSIVQNTVKALKNAPEKSRARSLTITKLEEASFWMAQAICGE